METPYLQFVRLGRSRRALCRGCAPRAWVLLRTTQMFEKLTERGGWVTENTNRAVVSRVWLGSSAFSSSLEVNDDGSPWWI